MGGHKPRSVQSSVNRPEHGDYITLSWAQSVTDNISQEAVGVGAGVGNTFAPSPPKEALNDLLQRAHNTMEDNDALPPAGVFEVEGANVSDDAAFPEIGFDQQNALCTTTIDAYDGKKLGITRKEIGPGGEAYSTVMGPTYVKIEFQDEASLDYPYVIPVPGKKDYVRAAPYGNARLLWHGDIDPSVFTEDCNSIIQNGYVNIGDDCWWQFFKLEQPLQTCGYAQAFIVDHCGNQIGTCKIRRTIWLSDINCASQPLPVGTVVLCLWFTWLNKWVAINWTEECPDFEEFTPPPSTIVKTTIPARFEVSAPEDPCNPDIAENGSNSGENGGVGSNANTRGGETQTREISGSDANNGGGGNDAGNGGDDSSCTIYLVYTETKYYKDNCGLFCLYDTEEKRIPLTLPTYTSYIPVYCTINETQGGSDSSSDESDSDPCACDSGRWIHIVYPEVQINCGKICFTGNTIEAPGCDISLTQDEPITQYDNIFTYSESSDICDDDTDNSDACHSCSTLTITQRTRTAKIACDEWCISEWTEGDSITIPVVACEGGEFTYVDNVTFSQSDECGCFNVVITYAPVSLHCGAVCPDALTQSNPIKVCMNGETDSIEVLTGVTGTIDITGASKTVLSDVSLDLTNLTLTGGTAQTVVSSATFDPSKLELSDKSSQTVVKTVSFTNPSLSINSVSIPTISGAVLDTSKLTLTGQDVSVLTGASITPVTGSLTYDNYKTVLSDVSLDDSKLSVSLSLTLPNGATVSIPVVKKSVVTDVSVDGCNITVTKDDIFCLDIQQSDLEQDNNKYYLPLSASLTYPSSATAYSGTVTASSGVLNKTTTTITQADGVNITGGVLTTSDTTIPIVTGITAENGAVALIAGNSISAVGSASLTQGSISTTTETISTPTTITVADPTDPPFTTTTSSVTVPNAINGQGGITKTTTSVTDAGSATYTANTTKKTLSFNHGVLCSTEESDSTSSTNNGEN